MKKIFRCRILSLIWFISKALWRWVAIVAQASCSWSAKNGRHGLTIGEQVTFPVLSAWIVPYFHYEFSNPWQVLSCYSSRRILEAISLSDEDNQTNNSVDIESEVSSPNDPGTLKSNSFDISFSSLLSRSRSISPSRSFLRLKSHSLLESCSLALPTLLALALSNLI